MKLLTYKDRDNFKPGIYTEKGIVDIASIWLDADRPHSVLEILQKGTNCLGKLTKLLETTTEYINPDDVKLCAPILRPGKVLALAGNYSEHIKECGLELGLSETEKNTSTPRPFIMPTTVVCGDGDEISWPVYSEQIDYELELCVVVGKIAKCVSPDQAEDHIAGYCIANDVSARSVTFKKERDERPWDEFYDWLNGKWADNFLPIGPYLTTKDEIGDVQNLDMELTVNGQTRQKANTGQMIYSAVEIVSFISHLMTLEPGDIICTGTPAGVAKATGNYLQTGDMIECEIEKLGKLTNTIGKKPENFYIPLAK